MEKNLLRLLSLAAFFPAFSQNIGIGTNTPAYKLDVLGRMRVKAGTLNQVNTSAGIWFDDYRNGNDKLFFGMKDSTRGGFYGTGSGVGWDLVFDSKTGIFSDKFSLNGPIQLYHGTNNYFSGNIVPDSNDMHITAKRVISGTRGNLILQANNSRGTLTYAGNVGIGINSPQYKLTLNGDMGIYSGGNQIGFAGNSGSDFLLNAKIGNGLTGDDPRNLILQYESGQFTTSGRVGIGTNAPEGKLHVSGSGELFRAGSTATAIHMTNNFIQFINSSAGKFFMQLNGNNFTISSSSGNNTGNLILNGNQVTIGQISPATGYKLNVGGKVICEELKVQLQGNWPDYVFRKDYRMKSFDELRTYIAENHHLPNIPAAAEMEKEGLEVGEMQRRMMEKIEELTLYVLQLEQQLRELKNQQTVQKNHKQK